MSAPRRPEQQSYSKVGNLPSREVWGGAVADTTAAFVDLGAKVNNVVPGEQSGVR